MNCQNSIDVRRRAAEMFANGFHRGAIDVLEVATRQAPDDGSLWCARAKMLHGVGRRVEALDNIERAQLLVPLDCCGRLILADGLREVGRETLAADAYLALAEEENLDGNILVGLYDGFAHLEMWRKAAQVSRSAVIETPDDDAAIFNLARALIALEQPAESVVPLLRRAVQLAPKSESYRLALVVQLLRQRSCDEAYDELRVLSKSSITSICCRGCGRRLLALAIEYGDRERAALIATQLATEAVAGK